MSIIILENRLDSNNINITGEIAIQPDASNEQIPQDRNSNNRPEHEDGPADPSISLESNTSAKSGTTLNPNIVENSIHQNVSQVDDIKEWEIERNDDPFFGDDKEDVWGDGDGWDDDSVTEFQDKINDPSTTNRIESLPQMQNVSTASLDVR